MKNTMHKRLLSFLMALTMVMSLLVMPAAAVEGEAKCATEGCVLNAHEGDTHEYCTTEGCNLKASVHEQCEVAPAKCATQGCVLNAHEGDAHEYCATEGCNLKASVHEQCEVAPAKCATQGCVLNAHEGDAHEYCATEGCNLKASVHEQCEVAPVKCATEGCVLNAHEGDAHEYCATEGCNLKASVHEQCEVAPAKCTTEGCVLNAHEGDTHEYCTTEGCNLKASVHEQCEVAPDACEICGVAHTGECTPCTICGSVHKSGENCVACTGCGTVHTGECTKDEEETPTCSCEGGNKCAEGSVNSGCPVCSAEGADLTVCLGTAPEGNPAAEEDTAPAGTLSTNQIDVTDVNKANIYAEISNLKATTSVAVKLLSGEKLLATTTLQNDTYFSSSVLGVKFMLSGTSSTWNTVWEPGMPRADVVPTTMELWVDGTKVSEAAFRLIKTNGEQSIAWADVPMVKAAPGAQIENALQAYDSEDRENVTMGLKAVNATSELRVELWHGETKLSSTTYGSYPVTSDSLTVNIVLSGRASSSWNTTWHVAPTADNIPDTIKVYVDGSAEPSDTLTMEGGCFYTNDGNHKDVYLGMDAVNPRVAYIGDVGYTSLADAVSAAVDGDTITITVAGTYKLPGFSKKLTIKAAENVAVTIDNGGAVGLNGAKVIFENLIFDYYPNVDYTGLQHVNTVTYNSCTFNGQVFLYGGTETFNNCTFNQSSSGAYNVWTYGAGTVNFNTCAFNSAGKSVLVYNEGHITEQTVNFSGCTLSATQAVDGKAAIEIDAFYGVKYTININSTTANGFGTGSVSGNTLWNEKKCNDDLTTKIYVNNELVWHKAVAQIGDTNYYTLQEAVDAAEAGDTVKLLCDVKERVTVSGKAVIIDLDGKTLTVDGSNHISSGSDVTFKNGSISLNGAGVTDHGFFQVSGNSRLTMDAVALSGDGVDTKAGVFYCSTGDASSVNISGGSVSITNSSGTGFFRSESPNASFNANNTTITLNNPNSEIRGFMSGIVNLTGTTFTMTGGDNGINMAKLTASGSTVTIKDVTGRALTLGSEGAVIDNTDLSFTNCGEGEIRFKADATLEFKGESNMNAANIYADAGVSAAKVVGKDDKGASAEVTVTGTEADQHILTVVKDVIKYSVHNLTYVPEVPATCTSAGTKAYYQCSGHCSERFADELGTNPAGNLTIPAFHIFGDDGPNWVPDAADPAKGHYEVCERAGCGEKNTVLHAHDFGNGGTKCVGCGYEKPVQNHVHKLVYQYDGTHHWQKCESKDGLTCNYEPVKKTHVWGSWTNGKADGTSASRWQHRECSICGAVAERRVFWSYSDNPKTGDYIVMAVGAMALSAAALVTLLVLKRRRRA